MKWYVVIKEKFPAKEKLTRMEFYDLIVEQYPIIGYIMENGKLKEKEFNINSFDYRISSIGSLVTIYD